MISQKQVMVGPSSPWPLRCKVTGNPCGTDTHLIGRSCQCEHCRIWFMHAGRRQDLENINANTGVRSPT